MTRKEIIRVLQSELEGEVSCPDLRVGCEECKYINVCILLDEASEEAGLIESI